MSNLVTKLNSILASKIAISGALEAKGVEVNNAPFSSYADLIDSIENGNGGESSLSLSLFQVQFIFVKA